MSTPSPDFDLETSEFSEEIRPADDLFRHVNERWFERTEIPSDKATYGTFQILREEAEEAIRAIVTEAQSAPPEQ